MHHTFATHAEAYWLRVIGVLSIIGVFSIAPLVLPSSSDASGFAIMINMIGLISLGILIYFRPKSLTLIIDDTGVTVTDCRQRAQISKSLEEVTEVRLDRWGHVLKFPISWISIRERGRSKPRYFGPIAGRDLSEETVYTLHKALKTAKQNKTQHPITAP